MDEKAPHMHLRSAPLTRDKRLNISARKKELSHVKRDAFAAIRQN